jgi:hypothetical protein
VVTLSAGIVDDRALQLTFVLFLSVVVVTGSSSRSACSAIPNDLAGVVLLSDVQRGTRGS